MVHTLSGIRFVKYLYKYCYKQLASAHMEITAAKTLVYDEIKKFLDVRYTAAPEAMWRLLEKPMQVKSHAVLCLHVHLRAERIRG